MPSILRLRAGSVVFEVEYYDELIDDGTPSSIGCLTRDLACHALFHYYGLAMRQYLKAKANLVDESELSEVFDRTRAMNILKSVSNLYGQPIEDMVKYWPLMEMQRIRLGGGDTLPSEFKFQFSVN